MGVGGQRHAPAARPPERDPMTVVQGTGRAPGPVWMGAENLVLTGIRYPDRPTRRESLYRLSYPGTVAARDISECELLCRLRYNLLSYDAVV
jgi:hypothetical protein